MQSRRSLAFASVRAGEVKVRINWRTLGPGVFSAPNLGCMVLNEQNFQRLVEEVRVLRIQVKGLRTHLAANQRQYLFLTKAEAARRLGICRVHTLPKLIASGLLHVVPGGRYPKVPAAEVRKLLRRGW